MWYVCLAHFSVVFEQKKLSKPKMRKPASKILCLPDCFHIFYTFFFFLRPGGSSYHLKWEGLSNSQQLLSNYITFLPELFHLISLESPWLLLRIMQKLLQVNSKHNTEFGGKCVSRRFMAKVDKSNAAQRMDKTWINCICCYCPHCENILSLCFSNTKLFGNVHWFSSKTSSSNSLFAILHAIIKRENLDKISTIPEMVSLCFVLKTLPSW